MIDGIMHKMGFESVDRLQRIDIYKKIAYNLVKQNIGLLLDYPYNSNIPAIAEDIILFSNNFQLDPEIEYVPIFEEETMGQVTIVYKDIKGKFAISWRVIFNFEPEECICSVTFNSLTDPLYKINLNLIQTGRLLEQTNGSLVLKVGPETLPAQIEMIKKQPLHTC